jgi:phage shock protein PspC (stress-responsive transcriptional regulator)
MKKTIRINIGGYIFNIDDDAYEKLSQYLDSINKQFVDTNEGKEIIADVESRIAELFQERIGDKKEVINISDIDYITEILGKPEDFDDSDEPEVEPVYSETQAKKKTRRIYRDPDNRVLSGLSAGLGAYFGIDPIIVRVIFIIMTLFYGTSVLIYIILWIVTPEAKSRSQKLEMKGQDINLSNIESSIKKEFKQVKGNFENWQKSKNYEKMKSNAGDVFKNLWKSFGIIFKIAAIFFGVLFLIIGIALLGGTTGLLFFDNTIMSPLHWNGVNFSIKEFAALFTDNFTASVLMISTYLLILIPILSIIYLSLKFIFNFKPKRRYFVIYGGTLWIVSLLVLIAALVKIAFATKEGEEVKQSYKIECKTSDTLYFQLFKDELTEKWYEKDAKINKIFIEFDDYKPLLYGKPSISIEKGEGEIELIVTRYANGINTEEAVNNAKKIEYEWQQDDSVFYFRRYFKIKDKQKFTNQNLELVLKIPVGKVIYFNNNFELPFSYINNTFDYNYNAMAGNYWIMTEDGLKRYGELENLPSFGDESEFKNTKLNQDTTKTGIKEEIEYMKAELDSM